MSDWYVMGDGGDRASRERPRENGSRPCTHNLLIQWLPGADKSMLAHRLATILSIMTVAEAPETTRIHSVAGRTGASTILVTTRPFRAPQHPISAMGRIGGGQIPMPGDGSLAHQCALFWDE